MIRSLHIRNFKSLRDVSVQLGRLNVLVGSNAGGKSNLLEVFRVLQGVGNGFTFSEILDGKPKGATSEVWEGIRGGSSRALFHGAAPGESVSIQLEFGTTLHDSWEDPTGNPGSSPGTFEGRYFLAFDPVTNKLTSEVLSQLGTGNALVVFEASTNPTESNGDKVEVRKWSRHPGTTTIISKSSKRRSQPVLRQNFESSPDSGGRVTNLEAVLALMLSDMQQLNLVPSVLRKYSAARQVVRMGERGENFGGLIEGICRDPREKDALLSWLRELYPKELDDFGTLHGALDEPLFALSEEGKQVPAPILSDGTLRFAAMAAAFFQPSMPQLITLEEIENGIHASRLRLLVELIRNRALSASTQVIVTTHSPQLLDWLSPEEHAFTFVCRRDDQTGESTVCPLNQIPRYEEVVHRESLAELLVEGWLEASS